MSSAEFFTGDRRRLLEEKGVFGGRKLISLLARSLDPENTADQLLSWLSPDHEFDMAPNAELPKSAVLGTQTDMVLKMTPGVERLTGSQVERSIARGGCCLIANRDMETINQIVLRHGSVREQDMTSYFQRMPTLSMLLGTTMPVVLETVDGQVPLRIGIHYEDIGFFDYAVKAISGSDVDVDRFGLAVTWSNLEERISQFPNVWSSLQEEMARVTEMIRRYSGLIYDREHEVFSLPWSQIPEIHGLTAEWIDELNRLNGYRGIDPNYMRACVVGTYVGGGPFIRQVNQYLTEYVSSLPIERQIIVKPVDHCETPPNMTSDTADAMTSSFVQGYRTFCRQNPMGFGALSETDMISYLPPLYGVRGSALALEGESDALHLENKQGWLSTLLDSLEHPFPIMENAAVLAGLSLGAIPEIKLVVEKLLDVEAERVGMIRPTSEMLAMRQTISVNKERIRELRRLGRSDEASELKQENLEIQQPYNEIRERRKFSQRQFRQKELGYVQGLGRDLVTLVSDAVSVIGF